MNYIAALLLLVSAMATVTTSAGDKVCGCYHNASLCQPFPPRPRVEREVMGYTLNEPSHAPLYNWSMLTTVAYYGADGVTGEPQAWETYCLAKEKGVKFVLAQGNMPDLSQLKNETLWRVTVDQMVARVTNYGYDGLHFDWELYSGLSHKDTRHALSAAVRYLSSELKARGLQFTAAMFLRPEFTLPVFAEEADFLMLMDYDQSWKLPGANAPYASAVDAIDSYTTFFANITPGLSFATEKIVLGLPWYGHCYGCTSNYNVSVGVLNECATGKNFEQVDFKTLDRVSRGESVAFNYTLLGQVVNMSIGYARVDFTPEDHHSKYSQFTWVSCYYDTPATLKRKYALAGRKNIRGVSMWTLDFISYETQEPHAIKVRAEMWDAVDAFLHPLPPPPLGSNNLTQN